MENFTGLSRFTILSGGRDAALYVRMPDATRGARIR